MPLGSSSAAPVIRPGPIAFMTLRCLRHRVLRIVVGGNGRPFQAGVPRHSAGERGWVAWRCACVRKKALLFGKRSKNFFLVGVDFIFGGYLLVEGLFGGFGFGTAETAHQVVDVGAPLMLAEGGGV